VVDGLLELDIKKYFDTIDHGKLREVLSRRVRDGVIVRLIENGLNAGVDGKGRTELVAKAGTRQQGGGVSPLMLTSFLA